MQILDYPRSLFARPDVALLAMRVMVGVVFVCHGAQELFGIFGGYGIAGTAAWMQSIGIPLPEVSATLAGATEWVGGLAFIASFGQRLLALPLVFTMVVAIVTAHTGFDAGAGGMEYPLTLVVVVAGLGVLGPGRFAFAPAKRRQATDTRDVVAATGAS